MNPQKTHKSNRSSLLSAIECTEELQCLMAGFPADPYYTYVVVNVKIFCSGCANGGF